jgi:PAS domain-containing protein
MLHSARPDGYLDFFNKRWLEYLGVSLDDLLGWRWTSVIHPDDLAQLVDRWQTSLVLLCYKVGTRWGKTELLRTFSC